MWESLTRWSQAVYKRRVWMRRFTTVGVALHVAQATDSLDKSIESDPTQVGAPPKA